MNTYSIYDRETGAFTGATLSVSADLLEENVPAGCSVVVGEYDHRKQRFDELLGEVVDIPGVEGQVRAQALEEAARGARTKRNARLDASDWVIVRAMESGVPVPAAWARYRSQLRDLTDQPGWPLEILWPTPPEE